MKEDSVAKRGWWRERSRGRAWGRFVTGGLALSLALAIAPMPVWAQVQEAGETEAGGESPSEEAASGPTEAASGPTEAASGPTEAASGPDVGDDPGTDPTELELLGDESATGVDPQAKANNPWDEGVSAEQRGAARAIFLDANQLARERFFATATVKYKQAIAIWAHPSFYFNLALAQLQLDQPIEAYESMERALQHGPEPLGSDLKYNQGSQQLAVLQSQLGRIEIVCDEPDAQVMLDGKPLFTGPDRYRGVVRPGAHQLVATRTGLSPVVEQAVLSPGEQKRFTLAFQHAEETVRERRWAAWKSWSVVGAGAALMLSGAYLDWDSTRKFDDYDQAFRVNCAQGCDDAEIPADLVDRRQRAEREQRIAVGVYVAGGAVVAAGAALVYLGRSREVRRQARSVSLDKSAVVPVISADTVGVRAAFRF